MLKSRLGETMSKTVELTLEVPSNMTKEETQTLLAIKLYETDRLSLGQAAEMSGYSKRAFIEILGHHKVPVVNYSPEELREELGL
jgi:predicted HTH domain antitoxin